MHNKNYNVIIKLLEEKGGDFDMKKTLIVSILMSIILFVGASVVSAATTETLADELYVKGKKYGIMGG